MLSAARRLSTIFSTHLQWVLNMGQYGAFLCQGCGMAAVSRRRAWP